MNVIKVVEEPEKHNVWLINILHELYSKYPGWGTE
jgi:hypothetical protein